MIAIIAGKGFLPIEVALKLKNDNKPFFIISLFPQDNLEELKKATDNSIEIIPQEICKVGSILTLLKKQNTKSAILIGKVEKNLLLQKLKFDWLALKLLASIITKGDSEILEKIVTLLEGEGISVLKQNDVLSRLIVEPGILCGNVDEYISENVNLGLKLAKEIAKCDIGQTIVIKDKIVIAIEAIEGTDKCISRGIELGEKKLIICKAAKNDQNKKFDLPTLGPSTLALVKKGEISAIAWESKHTLIENKEEFVKRAQELGITLISV